MGSQCFILTKEKKKLEELYLHSSLLSILRKSLDFYSRPAASWESYYVIPSM